LKATDSEILDIELHGYLDGELNDHRKARVEDYLDRERPAAERLVHYGVQGDLIRRLYGPLINRSMPKQMAGRLQAVNEQRYRLINEPEPKGRSRSLGKPFFIFLMVSVLVAVSVAAVWIFQPTLLERVSAVIKSLPVDKLSSLWS
jgi:anti-sigma factor RsiW